MTKEFKNINISIQNIRYKKKMNLIIKMWEKRGIGPSDAACEDIILAEKLKLDKTFVKLIKIYEMLQETLELTISKDDPEYKKRLEEMFSKVVAINSVGMIDVTMVASPCAVTASEPTKKEDEIVKKDIFKSDSSVVNENKSDKEKNEMINKKCTKEENHENLSEKLPVKADNETKKRKKMFLNPN